MKVRLSKDFRFEASHRLQHLPKEHPCHNMHGHSYRVEIEVYGEVDPATGFLVDYGEIKKAAQPAIEALDHSHLNDVEGLDITTTELLAKWLWDRIRPELVSLSKITVFETPTTKCVYEGE